MKQSPTRVLLVVLFVFLGCFGVAYAAAGMLTALPAPAIGGTCGPSTGSETALEALAQPGSIGAGPEPPTSNVTAHHQWETFIQQCQDLADRRSLASAAIFVISIVVAGVGLFWVLRKRHDGDEQDGASDDTGFGQPSYTPLGLHDPAALVGAGAVVGGAAPAATWPPAPQPGYGPPPGYPVPPPYPGAYPDAGYPQQAWPAQPPGYPQAAYPQPPAYPPPTYPTPPAYPAPAPAPASIEPQPPAAPQDPPVPPAAAVPHVPPAPAPGPATEPTADEVGQDPGHDA